MSDRDLREGERGKQSLKGRGEPLLGGWGVLWGGACAGGGGSLACAFCCFWSLCLAPPLWFTCPRQPAHRG